MNELLLEKFNKVEKIHWWWEGRRALLKQLLDGHEGGKFLDVGCGTGETMSFIKNLSNKNEIYGIDTSERAVEYSKDRGHKHTYKANALDLPFEDNFFDVILFLDVLEHIKDDKKAIKEAKRVLKDGGIIILTSPGLNFLWSAHDEGQGHYRRYTRREIRTLAREAGLKLSFISYFNFLLSPPIIAIRLLAKTKPFSFLADYDSGLNFDIAFKSKINSILRTIFVTEIYLLQLIRYPMGISIAAVFKNKE